MRITRTRSLFFLIIAQLFYSTNSAETFLVTKTTDTYPTGLAGQLRWAIQQANKASGTSTISFKIPGTAPFVIQPTQDLDVITRPVVINGYTQPGSSVNKLETGDNARLNIVLSGNNYHTGNAYSGTGNGLYFSSSAAHSVVKGLVINGWINAGIVVNGASAVSILGNFIGTDYLGTTQVANQTGIYLASSPNCIIGSSSPADRNIIAGSFFLFNGSACVALEVCQAATIQGNYIGTNAAGLASLGNSLAGISCIASNNTIIGGQTAGARNIISGHTVTGILYEGCSNTQTIGNYIGTDVSGTVALGNGNEGISLSGNGNTNSAINNSIINNVLSGNFIGIKLGYLQSSGANQNTIQSNFIGTDYTGTIALPNNYGIVINDKGNTIGGSTEHRNIISGNRVGGILLYGAAKNNVIQNNYIGLSATGAALPNGYGTQLGLIGGKGAVSANSILNNSFGGGNGTININA